MIINIIHQYQFLIIMIIVTNSINKRINIALLLKGGIYKTNLPNQDYLRYFASSFKTENAVFKQ